MSLRREGRFDPERPESVERRSAGRLLGVLFFLPVPLVLWLFTAAPLGVYASLGLGIVLMLTHRLYARPFALARSDERCLWSGATIGGGPRIELVEPLGETVWRVRDEAYEQRARAFLGWAARHARFVRIGILGSILVLLLGSVAAQSGLAGGLEHAHFASVFRLGVALTVLPLGWLGPRSREEAIGTLRVPFPVHIQALVGTFLVVWLFRLVGIAWLVLSLHHLATLAPGASS